MINCDTSTYSGVQAFDDALVNATIEANFKSHLSEALKQPNAPLALLLIEARYSDALRDLVLDAYRHASASQKEEIDQWHDRLEPYQRGQTLRPSLSQTATVLHYSEVTRYLDDRSFVDLSRTNQVIRQRWVSESRNQGLELAREVTGIGGLPIEERTPCFTRCLASALELARAASSVPVLTQLALTLPNLPTTDYTAQVHALVEASEVHPPQVRASLLAQLGQILPVCTSGDRSTVFQMLFDAVKELPPANRSKPLMVLLSSIRAWDGAYLVFRSSGRFESWPIPLNTWSTAKPLFDELWDACLSLQPPESALALADLLNAERGGQLRRKMNEAATGGDRQRQIDTLLGLVHYLGPCDVLLSINENPPFFNPDVNDMAVLFKQLIKQDPTMAFKVMPQLIAGMRLSDPSEQDRLLEFINQSLPPEHRGASLKAMLRSPIRYCDRDAAKVLYAKLVACCKALPAGRPKFYLRAALTEALCHDRLSAPGWEAEYREAFEVACDDYKHERPERHLLLALMATCKYTTGVEFARTAWQILKGDGALALTVPLVVAMARHPMNTHSVMGWLKQYPSLVCRQTLSPLIRTEEKENRYGPEDPFYGDLLNAIQQLPATERADPLKCLLPLLRRFDWSQHGDALTELFITCTDDSVRLDFVNSFCFGRKGPIPSDEMKIHFVRRIRGAMVDESMDMQARFLLALQSLTHRLDGGMGEELKAQVIDDLWLLKPRLNARLGPDQF